MPSSKRTRQTKVVQQQKDESSAQKSKEHANLTAVPPSSPNKQHRYSSSLPSYQQQFNTSATHRISFFITFSITLYAYLTTVSPSIAGGDSGELVAEGCQLGTSHPPGYPLYTIIVYLVTRYILPLFSIIGAVSSDRSEAWAVNVTSCMFGSLASALLSSSIALLLLKGSAPKRKSSQQVKKSECKVETSNVIAKGRQQQIISQAEEGSNQNLRILHIVVATTTGLFHSFSPLVWQYSITAEVFALHNLFVALIIHTSIQFAQKPCLRYFIMGAFVCGLALTNQHTSILVSVPMIVWVLYTMRLYLPSRWYIVLDGRKYNLIILAAGAFLSSLGLLYATLPILATFYPHAGSWGNVTSITGFMNHFRRKDYGTLQLYSGNDSDSEGLWYRVYLWGYDFVWNQFTPILAYCFIMGCKEVMVREVKRQNGKKQFGSNRPSANKIVGKKNMKSCREGCDMYSFQLEGPGVGIAIMYALLFYLLVFHSLANLPLNNELYFGIHQVSFFV